MFRNKKFLFSLTVLIVSSLLIIPVNAESELIGSEEISGESVNYSSEVIAYGDLKTTLESNGELYYPKKEAVVYNGNKAVFVKLLCGRSDTVKAGDKLVELSVIVDEVAIEEKELELQRIKDQYEKDRSDLQTQLDELKEDAEYNDVYLSRAMLDIQVESTSLKLELLDYQTELAISKLETELEKLYRDTEPVYIVAPISGKLNSVAPFNPCDYVDPGALICSITDESVMFIRCTGVEFNYGAAASVTYGERNKRAELEGEVIMSSAVIPGKTGPFSFIGLKSKADGKIVNIDVTSDSVNIQNVLLVPNTAKTNESGLIYITVMDDSGALHKRRIRVAFTGKSYSWVIDGLNEGDIVIKGRR